MTIMYARPILPCLLLLLIVSGLAAQRVDKTLVLTPDSANCGPRSLFTAAKIFGLDKTYEDFLKDPAFDDTGISNFRQLVECAERHGLAVEYQKSNPSQLKDLQGYAIVQFRYPGGPDHFAVITQDTAIVGNVIIIDPPLLNRTYTMKEFAGMWSGHLLHLGVATERDWFSRFQTWLPAVAILLLGIGLIMQFTRGKGVVATKRVAAVAFLILPTFSAAAPLLEFPSGVVADLGRQSIGTDHTVVFSITSTSEQAVIFDGVRSTCGCTSAALSSDHVLNGTSIELRATIKVEAAGRRTVDLFATRRDGAPPEHFKVIVEGCGGMTTGSKAAVITGSGPSSLERWFYLCSAEDTFKLLKVTSDNKVNIISYESIVPQELNAPANVRGIRLLLGPSEPDALNTLHSDYLLASTITFDFELNGARRSSEETLTFYRTPPITIRPNRIIVRKPSSGHQSKVLSVDGTSPFGIKSVTGQPADLLTSHEILVTGRTSYRISLEISAVAVTAQSSVTILTDHGPVVLEVTLLE